MKELLTYVTMASMGILFVVLTMPAKAQVQPGWPNSEFGKYSTSRETVVIPRKVRKIRPRKKRRPVKRKKAVASAQFKSLNGFVCSKPVTVTGKVKSSEQRAQASAWSQYHSSIKFSLGERYADERFAKDVRWQCIRSRSESLVAKTAEAVGGSVDRYRCQMSARPCMPPRE